MQIIYDEKKAIEAIEHINAKTPEWNAEIERNNRKLKAACVIVCVIAMLAVAIGVGWFGSIQKDSHWPAIHAFAYCCFVGLVEASLPFIARAAYYHNSGVTMTAGPTTTPTTIPSKRRITVTTHRIILTDFNTKLRTNISETIVNLDEKTVCYALNPMPPLGPASPERM